jgi:hypothetical protein
MRSALLILVVSLLAVPTVARAGSCPAGGCGTGAPGLSDYGVLPIWNGGPDQWDFETPWPNVVRIFPRGGYTAYPPRGVDYFGDFTPYRQIFYPGPPAQTAQNVQTRLLALGIPLVPPEPEFLGKNPAAEKIVLPPIPKKEEAVPPPPEEKKPEDKKPEDKKPEDKKPKDDDFIPEKKPGTPKPGPETPRSPKLPEPKLPEPKDGER